MDQAELRNGKPTVCVDFDGVLNQFDRWVAPDHLHAIRPGAAEFLKRLSLHYRVVILTVRWHEYVSRWLEEHALAHFVDEVTDRKPPAMVYLDDRAVCFTGDFDQALRQIDNFRPFWNT